MYSICCIPSPRFWLPSWRIMSARSPCYFPRVPSRLPGFIDRPALFPPSTPSSSGTAPSGPREREVWAAVASGANRPTARGGRGGKGSQSLGRKRRHPRSDVISSLLDGMKKSRGWGNRNGNGAASCSLVAGLSMQSRLSLELASMDGGPKHGKTMREASRTC